MKKPVPSADSAPLPEAEPKAGRRPYQAPAVVETAAFETLALQCTQLFGQCVGRNAQAHNS